MERPQVDTGGSSAGPVPDRVDLGHDSWVQLWPGFLDAGQAARLHQEWHQVLDWEARSIVLFGKAILQPRLVAWAGLLPYRYSGQTLPARPFAPALAAITRKVEQKVGAPFNHVLANRYRDGQDSMGQHADAEPELGPDPLVATLSFGATRPLVVLPRKGLAGQRRRWTFPLGSGDLFVMGGACQRHFRHGVPKVGGLTDERISLTFRYLLGPPSGQRR